MPEKVLFDLKSVKVFSPDCSRPAFKFNNCFNTLMKREHHEKAGKVELS